MAKSRHTLSIGLLNYDENGISPWLPLINWSSFGGDEEYISIDDKR